MRLLAIIPARGGSKRLPRKNLLPFRNRPMIGWTVDAAKESEIFNAVVVTTDDDEISETAATAGAQVLRRPPALGADDVPLVRVTEHVLAEYPGYDAFCLMMPNCPLRTSDDVRASLRHFEQEAFKTPIMSVFNYNWNQPLWALKAKESYLNRMYPEPLSVGIGDPLVCPSGAIRWCRNADFLAEKSWYPERLRGYKMPWYRAIDIDTRDDYEAALCVAHAFDSGFCFSEDGR